VSVEITFLTHDGDSTTRGPFDGIEVGEHDSDGTLKWGMTTPDGQTVAVWVPLGTYTRRPGEDRARRGWRIKPPFVVEGTPVAAILWETASIREVEQTRRDAETARLGAAA